MPRGGQRSGAGRPRQKSTKRTRSIRWEPGLEKAIEDWAESHGLDFTAAVHVLCRSALERAG